MIIDTSPYTIAPAPGIDAVLLVQIEGATVATIRIDTPIDATAPDGLHAELARLIENAPALLSTTRRYIHRLRTTMTQIANVPADSLAGIISAIEGPAASE